MRRDVLWDAAVIGFGNTSCDTGQRVGVTSERNGITDRIFVARRFEESDYRLGNGSLAGFIETIFWTNFV